MLAESGRGIHHETWGAGSDLRTGCEDRMAFRESSVVGGGSVAVRSNDGMQGETDVSDTRAFY